MKVEIYVLKDPATLDIRYVGKSIDSRKRLQRHMVEARNSKSKRHVSNWIRALSETPILEVIEICVDWKDRERYWISHYKKLGYKLCNHSEGGEGAGILNKNRVGKRHSKITKDKMSQLAKDRKFNSFLPKGSGKLGKNNNSKSCIHIESLEQFTSLKEGCMKYNLSYGSQLHSIRNNKKSSKFKYLSV